ncbi:MAG: zinc-ribbon and DUF3426 domain-containing protein [Gallionella sp.]|jgi:predicted Zn finger-like uncharacterized protein
MSGTTLCPHCGTRFRIPGEQLEIHHRMVRCGHCLKAFDPRPYFSPGEIDPQFKLPIIYETDTLAEQSPVDEPDLTAPDSSEETVVQSLTQTGQTEVDGEFLSKRSSWFWTIATVPLLLLVFAQATYLFRVELAAHLPFIKPALIQSCQILKCSVPLPHIIRLMSIESSEIQDDPTHKNQVILIAQLRNRAAYAQAFPNLELTLTRSDDKALARRIFRPEDYLPTPQNTTIGFPANQYLNIQLRLDTADLKPVGYRLVLFYTHS